MDYVQELVNLGYLKCCALKIVNDYLEAGLENHLAKYITEKQHAQEVVKQ